MTAKYSLLLVSPRHEYSNMWALKELSNLLGKKAATIPLALPLLAALTPEHYEITLVDEESKRINFNKKYDLVGISSIVTNISRAYEISAEFQKRGIPVILGGPYSSLNYEHSLEHADSVVIGEAEDLWPKVLEDFENGTLLKTYKCETPPNIEVQTKPRWDLIDTRHSLALNVQVSRGCPNGCDFCCVPAMFGYKQRFRNIDNVVEEIEALPVKQISFVDDNFTANREYTRQLCERLKPLEISWNCLCGATVAEDPELLRLMAESGCHTILIGFESLDEKNLKIAKKKRSLVPKYRQIVETINAAGIHVTGAFVVGFDEDTLEAFDRIYDFYMETDISYVMLNILTTFPGTALYRDMEAQNRNYDVAEKFLTGVFPSFEYDGMGPKEIFDKNLDTYKRIYSYDIFLDKMMKIYEHGNYIYPRQGLGTWTRISSMGSVIKRFVLSSNKKKRELIKEIFKLIKSNTMNADLIFEYLFFVEAANDYIDRYSKMRPELHEQIDSYARVKS